MDKLLRLSVLPLLVAVVVFAAVCVGQSPDGTPTTTLQPTQTITPVPTDTPVPTPTPTGTPTTTTTTPAVTTAVPTAVPVPSRISITSPQEGQVLVAGDIVVIARVEDFSVVDKQGQPVVPGEGHVHFYMDIGSIPMEPGKPAVPANATAVWAHVSGSAHTFTNVPSGTHTFTVQLVNNDHTPVIPVVADSVTVVFTGTTTIPTPTRTISGGY
jgi:hypothetical protein